MTSPSLSWLLTGKLGVTISLLGLFIVVARRLGSRAAVWSAAALLTSASLGVTLLPSILGAFATSGLIALVTLGSITPPRAWRLILWPITVSFALILCVGRVGCWLAGCCFGEVSHGWWSTQYTTESFVAAYHLDRYGALIEGLPHPVHSVQLYESLAVALALALGFLARKRWGEVSAALGLAASYLGIRVCIDPLRASVNTLSSLEAWGPLSRFQWTCLAVMLILLWGARRSRAPVMRRAQVDSSSSYESFPRPRVSEGPVMILALGGLMTALGGLLSIRIGTPFTAQLSALGVCLAATPLTLRCREMLRAHQAQLSASDENLVWTPAPALGALALTLASLSVALIVSATLPLSGELSARDGEKLMTPSSSGRAWVYGMDPLSKRVGRIGRRDELPILAHGFDEDYNDRLNEVDALSDPSSTKRVEREALALKEETPPRLRIALGGGAGVLKSESGGCGGEELYQTTNEWTFAHLKASYRHRKIGDFKGSIISAMGLRRLKSSEQPIGDGASGEITQLGRLQLITLGVGYQLESKWLKVGLAPRFQHLSYSGDIYPGQIDELISLLSDSNSLPIGLDYLLGIGYQGARWGGFLEVGSGPYWGGMPTQDMRTYFSFTRIDPGFELSLRLSTIGISQVTGILSLGLDLGVTLDRFMMRGSWLGGGGFMTGDTFGLEVGYLF